MNLVADESIEQQLVDHLQRDGHTVYFVTRMEPGIEDDKVLNRANERGALLVTGDKDFGEMVYRLGLVHSGVIPVRLSGLTPDRKGQITVLALRDKESEIEHSFTVISPGAVRIRRKG